MVSHRTGGHAHQRGLRGGVHPLLLLPAALRRPLGGPRGPLPHVAGPHPAGLLSGRRHHHAADRHRKLQRRDQFHLHLHRHLHGGAAGAVPRRPVQDRHPVDQHPPLSPVAAAAALRRRLPAQRGRYAALHPAGVERSGRAAGPFGHRPAVPCVGFPHDHHQHLDHRALRGDSAAPLRDAGHPQAAEGRRGNGRRRLLPSGVRHLPPARRAGARPAPQLHPVRPAEGGG